jgi:hypothetical protein
MKKNPKNNSEKGLIRSKIKVASKTPEQERFNALTKKVEALENKISQETEKLDSALNTYNKTVRLVEVEISKATSTFIFVLDATSKKFKLGKKKIESLRNIILEKCDELFAEREPTKEEEDLYDRWSEISYKEVVEEQEQTEREYLQYMIENMTGIKLDMSDFENTDEGFEKLKEKLKQAFDNNKANFDKEFAAKKPKKASKKETLKKLEEEEKQKSLRSIYISLVKVLHPDTETDPELKAIKEDQMKRLTKAYEEKDLTALLKLELEFVKNATENIHSLTDEKLKIYNASLKKRIAELEEQRYWLYRHPRYMPIAEYAGLNAKSIVVQIEKEKNDAVLRLIDVEDDTCFLEEETKTKTDFLGFIEDYETLNMSHDWMFDF